MGSTESIRPAKPTSRNEAGVLTLVCPDVDDVIWREDVDQAPDLTVERWRRRPMNFQGQQAHRRNNNGP
jgi:hypothetical protein